MDEGFLRDILAAKRTRGGRGRQHRPTASFISTETPVNGQLMEPTNRNTALLFDGFSCNMAVDTVTDTAAAAILPSCTQTRNDLFPLQLQRTKIISVALS